MRPYIAMRDRSHLVQDGHLVNRWLDHRYPKYIAIISGALYVIRYLQRHGWQVATWCHVTQRLVLCSNL
jgi:hypothetical protein